jgi:hypothetical protein
MPIPLDIQPTLDLPGEPPELTGAQQRAARETARRLAQRGFANMMTAQGRRRLLRRVVRCVSLAALRGLAKEEAPVTQDWFGDTGGT